MRNMSFALTTRQLLDGSKTVTRRAGWQNLKPGEHFMAVRKSRGLKRWEKVEHLAVCVCISNRRERLNAISYTDCRLEGFPELSPARFVSMFCKNMGGAADQMVSRIEFAIVEKVSR